MMRVTRGVASILLIVALAGCGESYLTREVAITSFELLGVSGDEVSFRLTGRWSNTCGEVSAFNSSKEGNVFLVSMVGRQPEGATCGQAMTDISDTWVAKIREPGEYEFRFAGKNKAYLDTRVDVR